MICKNHMKIMEIAKGRETLTCSQEQRCNLTRDYKGKRWTNH